MGGRRRGVWGGVGGGPHLLKPRDPSIAQLSLSVLMPLVILPRAELGAVSGLVVGGHQALAAAVGWVLGEEMIPLLPRFFEEVGGLELAAVRWKLSGLEVAAVGGRRHLVCGRESARDAGKARRRCLPQTTQRSAAMTPTARMVAPEGLGSARKTSAKGGDNRRFRKWKILRWKIFGRIFLSAMSSLG